MQTTDDICNDALIELGVYSPGETPDPALISWTNRKLNRMVDGWNAKRRMIFAMQFQQFTLVPNLQPHTIGVAQYSLAITAISQAAGVVTLTVPNQFYPGEQIIVSGLSVNTSLNNLQFTISAATLTQVQFAYTGLVTQGAETGVLNLAGGDPSWALPTFGIQGNRPTKIVAANLIINTQSPSYNIPINIRDADWWSSQRIQDLTSSYPTDLYYQPDWPNGSLFIWPVPTVNYPIQLETWTQLTQFSLGQTFSMPPAYWDAVVFNLAASLIPSLPPDDIQNAQLVIREAKRTLDIVETLNTQSPRIATGGDGLPSSTGNKPSFDWRTGFNIGTWSGSGR